MKKIGLVIMAFAAIFASHANDLGIEEGESNKTFDKVENNAFKPGEKLIYRLTYGIFDAGEAVLTVDETDKEVRGRKLWRVRGIGKTISAFEWFYKVNDRYESYMDAEGLFPVSYTHLTLPTTSRV